MRQVFQTDFDLKKQIKVRSKHTGLSLFITPRYLDHYVKHDYEPFSIEVLQRLLENVEAFVDIGAHYGYYGLAAHQKNPQLKVIAIEPVAENFALLKKNLKFNNVQFEAHNIAASNEDAEVTFNIIEASDSCGFYDHPLAKTKKTTTVQARKLDSLVGKGKLFIKLDVEGHEVKVLEGLKQTLTHQPPLLIEFNPDCQKMAGFEPEILLKKLTKLGYKLYFLNEVSYESHLYDASKPKSWRKFLNEHDYCNILCISQAAQNQVKKLFEVLLIARFIGITAPDKADPEKLLTKTKTSLEKKIAQLEKQKRANQTKLSKILKSDYFKAWQYLVNRFRRGPL